MARQSEHVLDDPVVEKGDPHLEGMGHAHSVDLDQDVVGEVDLRVRVEERVEPVVMANSSIAGAEDLIGV